MVQSLRSLDPHPAIRGLLPAPQLQPFVHVGGDGVAGDDLRSAQEQLSRKGWSIGIGRLVRPLGQHHAYRLCEGMRMPTVDHRVATIDDVSAIGALHVASWRETYAGLLPQDMLDGLSAENRAAMWATVLDAPASPKGTRVYVAERAGEIVGFGACGGQRDAVMRERGFAGEIGAIYTLRAQQGAGVGLLRDGSPAERLTATDILRSLISAIVLTPAANGLEVDVQGDLAGILQIASNGKSPAAFAAGLSQVELVAGTGFEPVTFRL